MMANTQADVRDAFVMFKDWTEEALDLGARAEPTRGKNRVALWPGSLGRRATVWASRVACLVVFSHQVIQH